MRRASQDATGPKPIAETERSTKTKSGRPVQQRRLCPLHCMRLVRRRMLPIGIRINCGITVPQEYDSFLVWTERLRSLAIGLV